MRVVEAAGLVVLLAGLLLIAGGNYFLAGLGLVIVGLWASGSTPSGVGAYSPGVVYLILGFVACVALAGCQREVVAEARPSAPVAPHLAGTVILPGSDGRVHVIKNPDPLGLDTTSCFVLIGPVGAQSIACAPPRLEITEPPPSP